MNLDDILNKIQDGDPKETFVAKLASMPSAEPVVAPGVDPTEPKVASANVDHIVDVATDNDEELMKKVAEEVDAQGRVMARAFYDELQKLAVGTQMVDTPHPGAMVDNPAVQMPIAMPGATPGQDATGRVAAIINQLKAPTEAGVSSITQTGTPVDYPPRIPVDESQLIAYDANNMPAKTSGDRILEGLFNIHVTEEGAQ
jgi:hypothetical protein